MKKQSNEVVTSFRGKLGALTGYKRNGQYYTRLSESVKDKSHSPLQLKQRSKFQVAAHAFGHLAPVFKIGYKTSLRPGQNGYNAGMSYNMQTAINTTDDGYSVNWSAVKVSLGALPNVEQLMMKQQPNHQVITQWTPNQQSGIAQTGDRVVIVFYDIEQIRLWAITSPELTRTTKEYCWEVPHDWIGSKAMAYVFTYQESSGCTSDSQCMGEFIL